MRIEDKTLTLDCKPEITEQWRERVRWKKAIKTVEEGLGHFGGCWREVTFKAKLKIVLLLWPENKIKCNSKQNKYVFKKREYVIFLTLGNVYGLCGQKPEK